MGAGVVRDQADDVMGPADALEESRPVEGVKAGVGQYRAVTNVVKPRRGYQPRALGRLHGHSQLHRPSGNADRMLPAITKTLQQRLGQSSGGADAVIRNSLLHGLRLGR